LGLDALKLLNDKNYLIFFITSILICVPLAFYYQLANPFLSEIHVANPTGKMTFGQMSEVLFMLLLPVFFIRFGLKKTLLIAMSAWALRYLLFAHGDAEGRAWMLILGIALHGICYDFFFVTGQIYTDTKAGEQVKSAAQGLITLATYGLGMLIGFKIAGIVADFFKRDNGTHDWVHIWFLPAAIALVIVLLFALLFKEKGTAGAKAQKA
jgi:nucleoside transporter